MDKIFESKIYINNYEDLTIINNTEKAQEHLTLYNESEEKTYKDLKESEQNIEKVCLTINNFDWETYINNYEDLQKEEINTKEKAWKHWTLHGELEGRTYKNIKENDQNIEKDCLTLNNFDWETYINNYEDLQEEEINTKEKAWKHWTLYGELEGRTYKKKNIKKDCLIINNFDWKTYVNNYKDLQEKKIDTREKAYEHWILHGELEGRTYKKNIEKDCLTINNFDWETYVNNYEDLQEKKINTREKAWNHWILYGKEQKRLYTKEKENINININMNINELITIHIHIIMNNNIIKNIYNIFYNKKSNIELIKYGDVKMYETLKINDLIIILRILNIKKKLKSMNKYSNNYISKLECILSCNNNIIINSISILNFIKSYNENNNFLLSLKKKLFINDSNKLTTYDELKNKVKNIQNLSKNKKLVYTNNLNSYDIFFDIDNEYKENDVDYIYISNINDINVCNNFTHVYCNINLNDNFIINRKIKFDKTLFDCYDKIIYIDSNIRINSKLNNFFNLLENSDLVLFSHPQRNTLTEEISHLIKSDKNHNKWELNLNKINELKNNFNYHQDNKLYWLSVQLSNTRNNIFDKFIDLYKNFNLKRDQIYFSLIQYNYKIKIIEIKSIFNNNDNNNNIDGDYGYINNFSNLFNRPFGGGHY
jgi:hypothetical protein